MKLNATMKTLAALLLVGVFCGQADAANKPLKGKYKCSGTATQSIRIGNIAGGSQSGRVKAKMNAAQGTFLIATTTTEWPGIIDGYLEPNLQQLVLSLANNTYKTMTVTGCSVTGFQQKGTALQNKNGKKVSFSIEQSYSCNFSNSRRVDQYELTCKR